MTSSLHTRVALTVALAMTLPLFAKAEPAHHDSIEWATANSDRVIIGKVIKVAFINKHAVVTVDVSRVVRGEHHREAPNPKETFLLQEFCSGYAKGWLEDGLPMMFFLVKFDGAKRRDALPQGFDWVLNDDGNVNSAVLLAKTDRDWPGTMDVFTSKYEYLSRPPAIVSYVEEYAKSIPPERVVESTRVSVPHGSSAYRKVFPPEGPGNAFFLRLPVVEQEVVESDWSFRIQSLIAAAICCVCVWCLTRWWARKRRISPAG